MDKMLLLTLIESIIVSIIIASRSKKSLLVLQIGRYDVEAYLKYLKDNYAIIYDIKTEKNNSSLLVMTNRAKRLYYFNRFFTAVISFILFFTINFFFLTEGILTLKNVVLIFLTLIVVFISYRNQPDFVYLSAKIIEPLEKSNNDRYYRMAKDKLELRDDLKVIAITGSFGKTSTKFIISTILSEKYNVLDTPESYNTKMGISKIINNELEDTHEVFVAELGARSSGEIRSLAELCKPDIGVITSIGAVHLETFINIDNIIKAKYELVEELPTKGIMVFNHDNEYIKKLEAKTFKEKINYGIENIEELDVYAEDIKITDKGSSFILKDKEGNSILCHTKLLGKHNVSNLVAGASVAKLMGLSFEEIRSGILKIEPVKHRLNVTKMQNGIILIDDSYNSNPIGAKAALDVMSQFKDGKKFIVTPGMINLGEMQDEANLELGHMISKVCDYVILVEGESSKLVYKGIIDKNYNENNIYFVSSQKEALKLINKIAKENDVVLFECNSIMDTF